MSSTNLWFNLALHILKTVFQSLSDLFTGRLPVYFYTWMAVFMVFVLIYSRKSAHFLYAR
ncbi:DUF5823 family protein [Paenibacillus donghaensis]|uniref:Uncharacterized protein n=1 Tax=Paenibacillus donghaensis TaxID=414771 RepID=A0A2Z2KDH3_9BACL|nr:DUF5823 family protein [Paenibacillus donghaensis]ASA21120.1 hypothetical protein B9T62_10170 [Paenibacillus donghaensis]